MSRPRIQVLDDHTINKMAAGEVIENPSSVVKELIENSLDAGASYICIEIQCGGRDLIRITDDGTGMTPDDAVLCFERHATSKLQKVEDLQNILTMGFRGEALPSIAAISKLSLHTSPREGKEEGPPKGTLVVLEGGKLLSCKPAARSSGTTIEVKSLFFNVPVRRKFQKSPSYDTQEILKVVGLLALANPAIHFELLSDHKQLLKTPATLSSLSFKELLTGRIDSILGEEFSSSLLEVKFQENGVEVEGFIASPSLHKPNRTGQHLFINQRHVSSPPIAFAVREGYGTMLPSNRFPLFVLHLRMPGSLLDVNVHPQKREVRLRQESQLKAALILAVQTALRKEQQLPEYFSCEPPSFTHPPFWTAKTPPLHLSEEQWEYRPFPAPSQPLSPEPSINAIDERAMPEMKVHSPPPPSAPPLLPLPARPPRILTTIVGYCLIEPFKLDRRFFNSPSTEEEGGLAILDQRSAFTRIRYEQLVRNRVKIESQSLLIPYILDITRTEKEIVKEYLPLFSSMGFELREFGDQSLVVDAIPLFFDAGRLKDSLTLILQDLSEMEGSRRIQMEKEEKLALVASRASLPSAKRLTIQEAEGLLQELYACETPAFCPQGRPTCFYASPKDISLWFKK